MQKFVQEGKIVPLTAPYNRLSGQGALVGSLFGVAMSDVDSGDEGQFLVEGVVTLPKSTGAWTQGCKIYWDDSAKSASATATVGQLIGVAMSAQLSGDTTADVRLNEAAPNAPATTFAALTDNSGGAAADGTIGVVTLPTLAGWNGSTDPTAAEATQIITAVTACRDAVKELATKVNEIRTNLRAAGIVA